MAEFDKKTNDILNEDSLGTKFLNGLKSNLAFLLTVLISVAFVCTGLIQIKFQEGDLVSIICNSIVGIIVGWLIKSLLGKQGLMNGLKTKTVTDIQEEYNNICKRNNAKSEYYPAYCEIKNEQKVKEFITTILTGVNLKYSCFIRGDYDNTSHYTNFKGQKVEFTKKQLKALHKARNPRIISVTPEYLINEITYDSIHERREESTRKFEIRRNATTFIGAIVIGIVLGYFSVSLIQDPSVANIIWTSLQMLIYIAIGFTEFIRRYLWCQNEHLSYIKRRIAYHTEFENMIREENVVLFSRIKLQEEEARQELIIENQESEVNENGD